MSFSFGASTGSAFGSGGTGSSIFGPITSQPSAFGGTNTASAFSATPAPTFGFGAATTNTAPATGGFQFGATNTQTTAPATGFGFGTGTTGGFQFGTTSQQPATGGFQFGATNTQPATGGFQFGATNTQAPAATGGFNFGGFGFGTTQAPQQPQTNLFATSASSGPFGFSNPQQQQQRPALMPPTLKFSELPEVLRKQFLELDNFIHQQSLIRDEIANHSSPLDGVTPAPISANAASPPPPNSLRASIDSISTSISSLSLKLNQELLQLSNFEANVTEQYREGEQAQRNINKLLMAVYPMGMDPAKQTGTQTGTILTQSQIRVGGGTGGVSLNEKIFLPSPYHWSKLQEFVTSIHAITTQVAVVEEYLATSQAQLSQQTHLSNPQALTTILQSQHGALVSVTGRVSQLHEQVNHVRDKFISLFGREGTRRLDEERKKEQKKREAFDLNAPNTAVQQPQQQQQQAQPLQQQQPQQQQQQQPAAGGFTGFNLTGATNPQSTGQTGTSLFGTTSQQTTQNTGFNFGATNLTAPATNTTAQQPITFGGFGTTPAATGGTTGGFGFGATTGTTTGGFGFGATTGGTTGGFGGFGTTPPANSTQVPLSQPRLTRQNSVSGARTSRSGSGYR